MRDQDGGRSGILKYAVALFLLSFPSSASWSGDVPFSLTSGPPAPVKIGDRFPVRIVVKNFTEKKFVLGRANHGDDVGQIDYTALISFKAAPDSMVQTVPVNPAHQNREGQFGYVSDWLEPGGSFTDTLHITDSFTLAKPGAYFLRLKRKVPDWLGKGEVVSNQIEIDIVE